MSMGVIILCSIVSAKSAPNPPAPLDKVGEWLSLVEHLVRDQGVGGSNPLSPTNLFKHLNCASGFPSTSQDIEPSRQLGSSQRSTTRCRIRQSSWFERVGYGLRCSPMRTRASSNVPAFLAGSFCATPKDHRRTVLERESKDGIS